MKPGSLPEPIAAMSAEHQYILAALSDLAILTEADVLDSVRTTEALERLIALLETHVYKEETLLFPSIREALGDDASAMEVLEVEHSLLADLRKQLHCLLACPGEEASANGLTDVVKLVSESLPPHIFKEDYVLYPLASQIISKDRLCEITAQSEVRVNG